MPVNWPQRDAHTDAIGSRLMNFSAMPCASRGGSSSKKQEAITIAASSAMPPEWFPTSMARPRGGMLAMPSQLTWK